MCSKYFFDIEKRPPAKVGVLQKEKITVEKKIQTTFKVGFPNIDMKTQYYCSGMFLSICQCFTPLKYFPGTGY